MREGLRGLSSVQEKVESFVEGKWACGRSLGRDQLEGAGLQENGAGPEQGLFSICKTDL